MKEMYVEVTFRSGEPMAAYLYLPRKERDRRARVETHTTGLLVHLSDDDRPIGIEIAISRFCIVAESMRVSSQFSLPLLL